MDTHGALDIMVGDHSNFIADFRNMAYSIIKLPIIDTQPALAHDQDCQTVLGPKITILPIITINPHPRLQKNLPVSSLRGPHGPQKLSSVVKKICIAIITEYASDKVFRGPHGHRIRG